MRRTRSRIASSAVFGMVRALSKSHRGAWPGLCPGVCAQGHASRSGISDRRERTSRSTFRNSVVGVRTRLRDCFVDLAITLALTDWSPNTGVKLRSTEVYRASSASTPCWAASWPEGRDDIPPLAFPDRLAHFVLTRATELLQPMGNSDMLPRIAVETIREVVAVWVWRVHV